MTTVFLVIGGAGLAILAGSLVFGEILYFGHVDVDGPFSLAAIAAFISAFGLGGAAVAAVLPDLGALGLLLATAGGVVAAVPAAWFAIRLTRAVMHMRTDATLRRDHLIGSTGVVVSPVPDGGYGEVRLQVAGQQIKFNAKADTAIPAGTAVFVIGAPTETSVVVEQIDSILPGA